MEIEKIEVYNLKESSYLTSIRCAEFSEAAAVCLDYHNKSDGVILNVEGDLSGEFELL